MSRNLLRDFDSRRAVARLRFFPRLKRSIRKRYLRWRYGDDPFVAKYFGTQFFIDWADIVAMEISLRTFERAQIEHFLGVCRKLKPELFIDIGANGGLYSCILLRNKCVPHAVLFEPDRRNLALLEKNLSLNHVLKRASVHDVAVGNNPGRLRLVPGPANNTGQSRLISGERSNSGYDVDVVRLDDILNLSGRVLAIKIDVEGHELNVLEGMQRLLHNNHGFVQIEAIDTRKEVIEVMTKVGYVLIADFYWDLVFEKP